MFAQIIILAQFITVVYQQCVPIVNSIAQSNYTFQNFMAGSSIVNIEENFGTLMKISENAIRYRDFAVNLNQNFRLGTQNSYQVALSISFIQNYYDQTWIDFSVRPIKQLTKFTIAYTLSQNSTWSVTVVHFLATSRDEIRAGNIIVDLPQLLIIAKKQSRKSFTYQPPLQIKKTDIVYNSLKSFAFVAGIRTKDRSFDLNVAAFPSDDTNLLNISIAFGNINTAVQQLIISYVSYLQSNNPVEFRLLNDAPSAIASALQGKKQNIFIGIVKATANNMSIFFKINDFTRKISKTMINQFYFYFQSVGLMFVPQEISKGVFVGYSPLMRGQGSAENCINFTECIELKGQFISNGEGKKCIVCKPFAKYNSQTKKCQCIKGYYFDSNGNCVNFSSICDQGDQLINNTCFRAVIKKEQKKCGQNYFYNITQDACICLKGFIQYVQRKTGNKSCIAPCKDGLIFNPNSQKCQCPTGVIDSLGSCLRCNGVNQRFNNGTRACECVQGAAYFMGRCLLCSRYATYMPNQKKCACNDGYVGSGFTCRQRKFFLGEQMIETIVISFEDT